MSKKKDEYKHLKEATPEKFQEIFVEWYLPAIKSRFLELDDRIKKLEEWRMMHDDTLTGGGG